MDSGGITVVEISDGIKDPFDDYFFNDFFPSTLSYNLHFMIHLIFLANSFFILFLISGYRKEISRFLKLFSKTLVNIKNFIASINKTMVQCITHDGQGFSNNSQRRSSWLSG